MGQLAEWLSQAPLRQGVGGEALVVDTEGRLKAWIFQVFIEDRQVLRHHQPFIGDYTGREGGDVEGLIFWLDLFLCLATCDKEGALQMHLIHLGGCIDKDLLNLWQDGECMFTAGCFGIHRDHTPAQHLQSLPFEVGFQCGACLVGLGALLVEEDHADRMVFGQVESLFRCNCLHKTLGLLHQQTTTVA